MHFYAIQVLHRKSNSSIGTIFWFDNNLLICKIRVEGQKGWCPQDGQKGTFVASKGGGTKPRSCLPKENEEGYVFILFRAVIQMHSRRPPHGGDREEHSMLSDTKLDRVLRESCLGRFSENSIGSGHLAPQTGIFHALDPAVQRADRIEVLLPAHDAFPEEPIEPEAFPAELFE